MADAGRLALAIRQAESTRNYLRVQLYREARRISGRLAMLGERLANDENTIVNSVGELQAAGPGFDVLCARYCETCDYVNALRAIRDET